MSEQETSGGAGSGRGKLPKWIAIIVVVGAALYFALKYLNIQDKLQQALSWIEGLGAIAPVVFGLVYVLCCIFLISGAILTIGAGVLFGLLKGTIYVSISSILGASAAFLIGRYFARKWVAKKIDANPSFQAIDEAVAGEGWKIVGLTRLSPIFPFVFLNYAFGLTKVSFKGYFFSSWIAMLPGTIMYVYIGSLAGDLAAIGGEREKTLTEWILTVLGLVATIAVTVFVTKVAKRALDKKIDEPGASSDA
jgi:uncharacterized membrane protein YdjX (TVP38/TMEM64 family)